MLVPASPALLLLQRHRLSTAWPPSHAAAACWCCCWDAAAAGVALQCVIKGLAGQRAAVRGDWPPALQRAEPQLRAARVEYVSCILR